MVNIHPTAIVSPGAEIGRQVEVGPYSVIEDDVIINEGCKIHSHVFIDSGARLGKNITIHKGAVVGTAPQDLKYNNEKTCLEVGEGTIIREFVSLNRGTDFSNKTVIGKNCLIMAYVHIAHDCIIGDNVIISNAVNMAGHVVIEDYAGIGGMTPIHQFVKIGQHAFVGGGLRVHKDVPPYILAVGEPLKYGGINSTGLARRGFSSEVLMEMKRAYRIIFKSNLTKSGAIEKIKSELNVTTEIDYIIQFIENSERGLIKG